MLLSLVLTGSTVLLGCSDGTSNPVATKVETTGGAPTPTPAMDPALREAWQFIRRGRPDIARMRIRGTVVDDDFSAQATFLMGLSHHVEKHYGRALPWLERACDHPDTYPPAWHFRGWALYWLGQPDEARTAFEHHLTLTPDEGDSHFAIGLIDLEAAQWDAAEARFNTAIELQRDRPDRIDGVAKATARIAEVVEQRDGDLVRAEALLAAALAMHGDLYEAGFRRARLLRRLDQHDEADAVEAAASAARDTSVEKAAGS